MRPPNHFSWISVKSNISCCEAHSQSQKWNSHNYTKEKSIWKILFLSRVTARADVQNVCVSIVPSRKHYWEYLVSLINSHSVDPAPLYSSSELLLACKRYKVEEPRRDGEDSFTFYSRLLEVSLWGQHGSAVFINCTFTGLFLWSHLCKWISVVNRCPNRADFLKCQRLNDVWVHICSSKCVEGMTLA